MPPLVRPHHQVLKPKDARPKVFHGGSGGGIRRPARLCGYDGVDLSHLAVRVARGGDSVLLQLGRTPVARPRPRVRQRHHSCEHGNALGGNNIGTGGTQRDDSRNYYSSGALRNGREASAGRALAAT